MIVGNMDEGRSWDGLREERRRIWPYDGWWFSRRCCVTLTVTRHLVAGGKYDLGAELLARQQNTQCYVYTPEVCSLEVQWWIFAE